MPIYTTPFLNPKVGSPAIALTYGASLTPDCNDGTHRSVLMTGAVTLNPPTSESDGLIWRGRFKASASSRALTLNASIKIPSEFSSISNPVTISSGATWRVQLEYDSDSTAWVLTGWTGGYS